MCSNDAPSRDLKSKGRSFLKFTKEPIMDISCREASEGHVQGGGPDSIALQSAVEVVNCAD